MTNIRVLVASDSALLREGIQALLSPCPEVEIVGIVEAGGGVIEDANRLQPAVLILDVPQPDAGRLEMLARLRTELPQLRVIAVGYQQDEASILRILDMGVRGYLCGREGPAELISAVQAVSQDGSFLCPNATGVLVRRYRGKRYERSVEVAHDGS